jgi:endonuclease/exonuclease/phosphatase family metal-dependent hydrolase
MAVWPGGGALPAHEARVTEGAMAVAHPRTPSPRLAASRRLIAFALALCATGAARAGDLVPIRIPGTMAAPVADMPPLVPIVRPPPEPVAIRTLPVAPVAVQPPVLTPSLPPMTAPPAAIVAPPVAAAPPMPRPLPLAVAPPVVPPAPVVAAPPVVPSAPLAVAPPIVPPHSVAAAASMPPAPVAAAPAIPQPPHVAAASAPPMPAAPAPPPSDKPNDAVLIASFNIQVFGEAKLAKPQVVDVLTRVVRHFDVVAVQEVRAKSDSVVPTFVAAINADGSRYQYVVGPRLGRTSSKEQYTFIYDSTRIEIDPSSVATLPNPGDKLHRPPLRARFRVRANPPEAGFSFWLVDIHTDPDEVPQEVDALADAFVSMRSVIPDEDDVILLGDLNAGPPQFGRIKQIPGIGWAVSGATTNTRRSKTYDNLIFDRTATTEYTGRWGVLDLQQTFGLPLDKALEVSDHNPVWAAFSPWETRRIAGR